MMSNIYIIIKWKNLDEYVDKLHGRYTQNNYLDC